MKFTMNCTQIVKEKVVIWEKAKKLQQNQSKNFIQVAARKV